MAGAARERPVVAVRQASQPKSITRVRLQRGAWLPPLLLALLVVAALVAAYSVRPTVRVDLGDYYDRAYVSNFNDREIGALASGTTIAWPADRDTLEVAGSRPGLLMATVSVAAGVPDKVVRDYAVSVNDVRVPIARTTDRAQVVIVPTDIAASPTLSFKLVPGIIADPPPPLGTAGALELTPAQTYRWSKDASSINMPGIGRGDWQVTLDAVAAHPDGSPLDATVLANGVAIGKLPPQGENRLRRLHFFVPSALVPDGDLTLTVAAQPFAAPGDARTLGVNIGGVSVAPASRAPLLPPPAMLLAALIIGLGLYVCLLRMTLHRTLAAGAALLAVLGGAWFLAQSRYPAALMLPREAVLVVWSVVLLLVLERAVAWGFARAGVPLGGRLLRALLLVFFLGYWLKAGAMLYPYFVGIDVAWHMGKVERILGGEFWTFYGINSPLNESTMPVAEWGAQRPVIPYSPWFHLFATSFALVPLPLVLTAQMFSALVDSSRVFLIALLARKGGLTGREALFAALIYTITPATFLLHSWGNIPTTFGIWWTLISTVYIVVAYRRLDQRAPFVVLTLLLLATMLCYTVMAAFMTLFVLLLVPLLWLLTPRGERRPIAAIALAMLLAIGISTLIYYGQYIPPIIARTIPYFTTQTQSGAGIAAVKHDSFGLYLEKYLWRSGYLNPRAGAYGLYLLFPLGLVGMFRARDRRLRAVFACWLAVALLFAVVGSRVTMVDKQVFYLIPALCVGFGLVAGRLWRRGALLRAAVVGVYLFTFAAALNLWLYRIVTVRQ